MIDKIDNTIFILERTRAEREIVYKINEIIDVVNNMLLTEEIKKESERYHKEYPSEE